MEAVKEEKMKEKAEREKLNRPGGGAMNALMAAGALADDTLPTAGRLRETDANRGTPARPDPLAEKAAAVVQAEEKEILPEPSDQKVQLLKSLLCIGAIPESLYILGRFPWLPDAFPELPEYIHRILHHCLHRVYDPLRPLSERTSIREQRKVPDPDQAGVPRGQVKLIDASARKVLRWALLDKDDTNEATDYRFYWEDWADNVPVCQTVDDVFLLCGTLLNYSGVKIGQDPALLLKLARIGKASLANDSSNMNLARWIDLSKRLLVPALSLTKCNPGVVNEVFELLKNFTTRTRYSIYAEWYSGQVSRLPDIKAAFDQARAETKDVLKRISKTNLKSMARALAKVAYASPGIVFTVAIGQIESYDNLVEVVVECARYFTYLGYDVLTWSLMSSLGAKGRERVQADGMLTSRWLAALSLFAGKVFKRYSVMNPTPILQYVTEQLRKGNSTDLIVLEEITSSMAGIVSDTNFNEVQTQALAGGELLQAQTMLQLLDKRHESKTTAKRLMRSLTEPKLVGQLLVSIAQERQTCIFKISEPDAHLKLLGNLFDEIHRVLTQYLDLLRSNLSVKEFDTLVPAVSRLIGEFGVEPNVAFWISRPSITQEMITMDKENAKQTEDQKEIQNLMVSGKGTDGDIEMKGEESDSAERSGRTSAQDNVDFTLDLSDQDGLHNGDLEMKDAAFSIGSPQPTKSAQSSGVDEPWHPVLKDLITTIKPALPEKTWESLSVPFYVTFWQLSLHDMLVPTQSYDDEINRQKKKILAVNSDRTDISLAGTQKKEREKQALNDLQDRLRSELKGQVQSFSQTRARLQKEKDRWFAGFWGKWDALNTALIEHCFFPRLILSPTDALYSFKMFKFLHSSGTPNFRTMGVIDHLFREKKMTSLMFLCTAKEAENFGRFLNELLRDLSRWHADKAVYEKEAFGTKKDLPGFARKMSTDKIPETFCDFEDFRRVLYKWHRVLSSALKTCITSGEYMHIRNAIIILKAIHQYFPAVNWIGRDQLSCITELSKTEIREDLKIAATSLLGNLKRREKQWMLPQAFHLVSLDSTRSQANGADGAKVESANVVNGSPAGSARAVTPQPDAVAVKTYNAAAPEYRPTTQPNVNGVIRTQTASGKLEVEDGEIEDAKAADAKLHSSTASTQTPKTTQHQQQQQTTPVLVPEVTAVPPAESEITQPKPIAQVTALPQAVPTLDANALHEVRKEEPKSMPPLPANNHTVSPRPDLNRTSSNNGRIQHVLPNRPEVQLPRPHERQIPDRPGDRVGRDGRDMRFPDTGRPERPGDFVRDRLPDRQSSAPMPRGNERIADRPLAPNREREATLWGNERESYPRPGQDDRFTRPPGRDSRPSSRGEWSERAPHDRPPAPEPFHASRVHETQARPSRDLSMAPPRSNVAQHPDRAVLIHGPPHPDRPALFNGEFDRPPESLRYNSREERERTSRPQSPSRHEDHRLTGPPPRYGERRDERPLFEDRRSTEDSSHGHPARYEDSHPPTGPRGDRPPRSSLPDNIASNDRSIELLRPTPPVAPPADPNHGRLNQESSLSSRQQDPNYGRLNPGPEIPSGPRGRNSVGRGGRNVSVPQPHVNTQQPQLAPQPLPASPSVPDRPPPTGPLSSRGGPRAPPQFGQSLSAPVSGPPTPATAAPDTSGIHPDRLNFLQLQSVESSTPPQIQTRHPLPSNDHVLSPMSAPPPSGPRGSNHPPPSPVGPSPTNRGPPTGPSFGNDRTRGDKRFAGLQNMLQQAGAPNGPDRNGQGASIRGRGGRPNNVNVPSPIDSGPPTPSVVRPDTFPTRPDLFNGRSNGMPTPQTEEERSSSHGGRRDSARDGERRSGRHRGSRPHSEDRERRDHEDDRAPRRDEHRDRRGGGGAARDDRNGRRGRDEGKDRDRRAESDRRDMEDWGDGRMRDGGGERRDERDRRD
ncbi:MAG: THO complex subunit 2, partial [Pleopsidium flavum]